MQDVASGFLAAQTLAPADRTADTNGSAVTTGGYQGFLVVVDIGAVTIADASNYFEIKMQYSTDGVNYTDVDSADYITVNSWDRLVNATTEANASQSFGLKLSVANVSHLRAVADENGTAQALFGVTVMKGAPPTLPQ